MTKQPRRIERELTPEERARVLDARRKIQDELPDLMTRDRLRHEARQESTLSGELRRAIHASPLSLSQIAEEIGIPPLALDEFLTGERTLRSDVLDRLAAVLEFDLSHTE